MPLIHCIYSSAAAGPLDTSDLEQILATSRRNNGTIGVTGMLLHTEGSFFQVLEGEEAAVDRIYTAITGDARHTRVTRIIREAIARRSFAEWSMGFADISAADLRSMVDVNDFFGAGDCLTTLNEGRAKKLLRAFGGGRWRARMTTAA